MNEARTILAGIAWMAAIVITAAALRSDAQVFGIAGVIGALAALGWGLLTAICTADPSDDRDAETDDPSLYPDEYSQPEWL